MSGYKKYWIWLSMALGAGARTDEILSAYASPEEIYAETRTKRIISGVFTKRQLDMLEKLQLKDAESALAVCERNGWHVCTPPDSEYPEFLKNLANMPLVLYVDGDVSVLNGKLCIGVVGTRNPCAESVAIAQKLSGDLSAKGAVIVSGGALGIDSAAHEGALAAGGKTVCVLGCGLGNGYLMANEPLRRRIAQNGALVSEYTPLSSVTRASFPLRNRIISGLSEGVLVVEAGEKSGSLITARCACEQGKDVFAIPGSILSTAYLGANRLIKDGAKAVTCADDILESYAVMYPEKINGNVKTTNFSVTVKNEDFSAGESVKMKKAAPDYLDPDAAAIYNIFKSEPLHADEICAMTGLGTARVLAALLQLELEDLIKPVEGKCYILGE